MYTGNIIHKINKNDLAEMDLKGSKAYRVPLQLCLYCSFRAFSSNFNAMYIVSIFNQNHSRYRYIYQNQFITI